MQLSSNNSYLVLFILQSLCIIYSNAGSIRRRRDSSILVSPLDTAKGRKQVIMQETNPDEKFIPFLLPFHIKPDIVKYTQYFAYATELMQEEGGAQKLMDILLKPGGMLSNTGSFKFGSFGGTGGSSNTVTRTETQVRHSTSSGSDWSASSSQQSNESEESQNAKRGRSMKKKSRKLQKTGNSITIFRLDDSILLKTDEEERNLVRQLAKKYRIHPNEFRNIKITSDTSFVALIRTPVAQLIRKHQRKYGLFVHSIEGDTAEVEQITVATAYKKSQLRS